MFGLSAEHLLILGIILLIFGPRRLPELGNTLGKAMKNFKDSLSGVEEPTFRKISEENVKSETPGVQKISNPEPATTSAQKVRETEPTIQA